MSRLLRALFFVWVAICPLAVVNLYPVRNSGIYLGVALLSLLLVLTALQAWRRPESIPWRSRLTVPLVALGVTAVAAGLQGAVFYDHSVLGKHRHVLVQIYAVALVVLSAATPFAVAAVVRSLADARLLRALVIAVSAALLLKTALRLDLPTTRWWPMVGTHALAMVLASLLFERHSSRWPYVLGALFAAATVGDVAIIPFFAAVRSQWISGWIAITVPAGLLLLYRFPRAFVGLALPAAALVLYWNFDLVERVVHLSREEGDFLRFRLWEDAASMTFQRPLLGIGPGNYLDYVMRYGQLGAVLSSPHGNYQQIGAEMGLVGLGFTLWLFWRCVSLGWRLHRSAADPLVRSLAIAASCSLAGQFAAAFIGDFVLPSYHNGGYHTITGTICGFVVVGLLMSLERAAGEQPR